MHIKQVYNFIINFRIKKAYFNNTTRSKKWGMLRGRDK